MKIQTKKYFHFVTDFVMFFRENSINFCYENIYKILWITQVLKIFNLFIESNESRKTSGHLIIEKCLFKQQFFLFAIKRIIFWYLFHSIGICLETMKTNWKKWKTVLIWNTVCELKSNIQFKGFSLYMTSEKIFNFQIEGTVSQDIHIDVDIYRYHMNMIKVIDYRHEMMRSLV